MGKYWVILEQKNGTVTDKWKVIKKFPKDIIYSFPDLKSALLFYEKHYRRGLTPRTELKIDSPEDVKKTKFCPLCAKPHSAKTQLCHKCNREKSQYDKRNNRNANNKMTIKKLLYLKSKIGDRDIWGYLKEFPNSAYVGYDRSDATCLKAAVRNEHKSYKFQLEEFQKWDGAEPEYIAELFKKNPMKEFLTLSGSKKNPNIHYVCKRCNEEQVAKYENFHKGHNCISSKPSGEIIVEEFLRDKHEIRTQFETLKCINPVTGRQLPYDIEIPRYKLIIEINGNQHNEYSEFFHGSYEGFRYQLFKDAVKKDFAKKQGYSFVVLDYAEIGDGSFRQKIEELLSPQ